MSEIIRIRQNIIKEDPREIYNEKWWPNEKRVELSSLDQNWKQETIELKWRDNTWDIDMVIYVSWKEKV